jgi:hypothetical protein
MIKSNLTLAVLKKQGILFFIFFVLYFLIDYAIRDDEPFWAFASFEKIITLPAFMSMYFVLFDERNAANLKAGNLKTDARYYVNIGLAAAFFFLLFSVPLTFILYFIFHYSFNEKINLGKEIIKLAALTIVFSLVAMLTFWLSHKAALRRNRKLNS